MKSINVIKISVIIPLYNSEKYLLRALESLFNNHANLIEYIFVNDASTDSSLSILEDYISRAELSSNNYQIISLIQNRGSATARNEGLKVVKGDYIAFFDADDWIEGNGYIDMYNYAIANNLDLVWSDFFYSNGGNHTKKNQNFESDPMLCIINLLKEKLHGALWNKLYKRDLFHQQRISFPDGQDYWEDLSTNVMLFSKAKKIGYLNNAYYYYYQANMDSLGNESLEVKLGQILFNCNRIIEYLDYNFEGKFDSEINFLKLAAKQSLLFTTNFNNFIKWEKLYKESNRYVSKFKSLPIHLRLLGWACANKIWWIVRVYIFFKKCYK